MSSILVLDQKSKKVYDLVIPKYQFQDAVDKRIDELLPNIKVGGFRKGHVPRDIVFKNHSESIIENAISKILNAEVLQILKDNSYDLALDPTINLVNKPVGIDEIKATVTFELCPLIPEIDYSKISIDAPEVALSDEDINEEIDNLRKIKSYLQEVAEKDYVSMNGDVLNITFHGKIDGKSFHGSNDSGYIIELGSKSFLPEFELQLLEKKVGDRFDINLTFPSDYQSVEIRNKDAVFNVIVNNISKKILPNLDDEFAKSIGYDSVDAMKAKIPVILNSHYLATVKMALKQDVFSKILDKYDFDVPESILNKEIHDRTCNDHTHDHNTHHEIRDDKEYKNAALVAAYSVKVGYLVRDIMKRENISITNDDVLSTIKQDAMYRGISDHNEILNAYIKTPEVRDYMISLTKENKVLDVIWNKITIEKTSLNRKDLDSFLQNLIQGVQ